ncbi:hypothetical protein GCM10025865_10380 [Paraoerskovia sediminicola]|uniref:Histidine kinase/HSP90-like ATPase domain-containing protein n=1 Tax=Paraoerskovia sediminicola TaxID=1138587 RepID=A0ABM8G1D6_9CELL|nr:ATP-binding protein [Paraoerskovia sediminicola]BDZ41739.1 hypothetical protein GCM10025865_10380 [Paraoerskovia sediminicola]
MTAQLSESPVPAGFDEVARWALHSVHDLHAVRASVREAVRRENGERPAADSRGASAPQRALTVPGSADAVALVASELCSNALQHGGSIAIVRLCHGPEGYLLDVVDRSTARPPEVAGQRGPGEGGFGLLVASRLSAGLGWTVNGLVKHVWAMFPAPAPSRSPADGSTPGALLRHPVRGYTPLC